MGSFEWMELQTLTSEIAHARSRLAAARKSKDTRRARTLEEEIAASEARRERLLGHITSNLVSTPAAIPPADESGVAAASGVDQAPGVDKISVDDGAPVEAPAATEAEPQPLDLAEPVGARIEVPPAAAETNSTEGATTVWEQLTPNDIERARNELGTRRAEILARHAEELRGLDGDQAQLDTLEQAIAAFAKKFNLSPNADVVRLDSEREMRHQGRA